MIFKKQINLIFFVLLESQTSENVIANNTSAEDVPNEDKDVTLNI